MKPHTLSKSRFKLALECPTKVYYSLDPRYANRKQYDDFLQALAKGGHQVGALARLMFLRDDPGTVEVTASDQKEQICETAALLQRENVTIFEATILHGDLLVRVDVLVKRGRRVDLFEVKAKSWDRGEDSLSGKTAACNALTPKWEPYVYDVAFQEHVVALAYPEFEIRPWLMLVDKRATNSVPGLARKFVVKEDGRHVTVEVEDGFNVDELNEPLLIPIDASEAVRLAQTQVREKSGRRDIQFDELIAETADAIRRGDRLGPFTGQACKLCEFYCAPQDRSDTHRSGWAECMETRFGVPVEGPREDSIFGFYKGKNSSDHLDAGRLWIRDLNQGDLEMVSTGGKISIKSRHQLQWEEQKGQKEGLSEPFLQKSALQKAVDALKFPLHFIDFETVMPAIPFHAGHRPYQQILFQFSHHVMSPSGEVRHASECLITEGAASPSIEVVRRLREAIGNDRGAVLHWYPHERTVLRQIHEEITAKAPPDAPQLLAFLEEMGLTKESPGRLFDLGTLIADQVFLPGTGGSSSMKKFLPATLRCSAPIRARYAQPVYGTAAMPSLNFHEQVWVVERDGVLQDPYQLLGVQFAKSALDEAIEQLAAEQGDFVANGAKAMMAYARLQDPRVPQADRDDLHRQLLRYCELDTLAMVMVYQAVRGWIQGAGTPGSRKIAAPGASVGKVA